jgi:hypothetical protein
MIDRLYRVERDHRCVVHLPACRHLQHATAAHPWLWAEGRTVAELLRQPWNIPCRTCLQPVLDALGLAAPRARIVGGSVVA